MRQKQHGLGDLLDVEAKPKETGEKSNIYNKHISMNQRRSNPYTLSSTLTPKGLPEAHSAQQCSSQQQVKKKAELWALKYPVFSTCSWSGVKDGLARNPTY